MNTRSQRQAGAYPFMVALRALAGVDLIVGDPCAFGQGASYKDENGQYSWALVRKRTGWLTNHPRLKVALNAKCPNCKLPLALRHKHIPTLVGGRAKSTEIYPPRLVHTILKAHVEQLKIDKGVGLNSVEIAIGPHVDEDPCQLDSQLLTLGPDDDDSTPQKDDSKATLPSGKVYDEYTGELLDSGKVAIARQTELDFSSDSTLGA